MDIFSLDAFFIQFFVLAVFSNTIECCETGTYRSTDLGGCVECPGDPLVHCYDLPESDIDRCLKKCLSGRNSPTGNVNLQNSSAVSAHGLLYETTQKQNDPKCGGNEMTGRGGFLIFFIGAVIGVLGSCLFNRIKDPFWKRRAAFCFFGRRQAAKERRQNHVQITRV
ncbi:uncharacterized protein LOC114524600 [Dendronephthya gigantea]|uniref:uncharacterized protein LOC114524600 n=1 Tax=Dendronephthya gigantea TaxID=151771 RepID=UPI0010698590|nr:uncharacterized protein LOC114524600 [Dendronephthya gigantea]